LKRRELLILLGGMAAYPMAASAQQSVVLLLGDRASPVVAFTPEGLAGVRKPEWQRSFCHIAAPIPWRLPDGSLIAPLERFGTESDSPSSLIAVWVFSR
jgi:hypothetical protein